MTTSSNSTEISILFSALQQQFLSWRAEPHKPYRVPHSLRKLALEAIDSGLTKAQCDQLGISGHQIKLWKNALTGTAKQPLIKPPRFVQCKPLTDEKKQPQNKPLRSTSSNDELISIKLTHPNGLQINIEPCTITSATHLLQSLLTQGNTSCSN